MDQPVCMIFTTTTTTSTATTSARTSMRAQHPSVAGFQFSSAAQREVMMEVERACITRQVAERLQQGVRAALGTWAGDWKESTRCPVFGTVEVERCLPPPPLSPGGPAVLWGSPRLDRPCFLLFSAA